MNLVLSLTIACLFVTPMTIHAEEETAFTILYTNDVHCAIDGYVPFGGYKAELQSQGKTVIAVDAGDCIQGDLIGTYTEGTAVMDIMNEVPYDVAIPGNHEFDYEVDHFLDLASNAAKFPYICCNFLDQEQNPVFDRYLILEVEGYRIGFVGIVTPETVIKSTPRFFQDENGNYIYSFADDEFYNTIQSAVDDCKEAGADIVIAVGHVGIKGIQEGHRSIDIIEHTRGISAFIDGHSHEVYEGPDYKGTVYKNLDGEIVPVTQTGTKFTHYGEMTVTLSGHGDELSVNVETHLLEPETTELTSEEAQEKAGSIQKLIDSGKALVDGIAGQPIGTSEALLPAYIKDTTDWLVRIQETSLGDFVADAYRWKTGADIGIVNSGGVRADLPEGDLKASDAIRVNPWIEQIAVISASGQTIADALEMAVRSLPEANGGFFQVSGITFTVNTAVESPVIRDENGMMTGIDESKPRRISDLKVGGEPIDPDHMYTVASNVYVLQESGDGQTGFAKCETLSTDYPPDAEVLIEYVKEELGGVISAEQYGNPDGDGRMRIVTEEAKPAESRDLPLWAKVLVVIAGLAGMYLLMRTPKQKESV